MPRRRHRPPPSALAAALDRVGDRWTLLVVDALADGPQRFGELRDQVGAATNILSDRLRRLEVEGLVVSSAYSERPLRLEYALTVPGRELARALAPIAVWGGAREGMAADRFHETCGTAVELRPWCPTCDRALGATKEAKSYDL